MADEFIERNSATQRGNPANSRPSCAREISRPCVTWTLFFGVVISGTQRAVPSQPCMTIAEDGNDLWAAVDEVVDEHGLPAGRRCDGPSPSARRDPLRWNSRAFQEFDEFIEAAVDVADDVEGAVVGATVVPERLAVRVAASASSCERMVKTCRKPSRGRRSRRMAWR